MGQAMPDYWVDTSAFIHAKDGPYGFDRVPGFWSFLDEQASAGVIASSSMVYGELMQGRDQLKAWVKSRKSSLFLPADTKQVQREFSRVADYVSETYPDSEASLFLSGADPWIIAHALTDDGVVVSTEGMADPRSKKPKIPIVASHFGLRPIHYWGMLTELNATFT